MTFIFIDGSYFVFYRYFATLQWWNCIQKEEKTDLHMNEEFVTKFIQMFERKLKEIPNKLKIHGEYKIIIALDCPRTTIWRNEFHDNYKGSRKVNDEIGHFFKIVMDNGLFEKSYIFDKISMECLEADDCIALSIKYIRSKNDEENIYVITNDHDYLQLNSYNINLVNLKYQIVGENKTSGDPHKDLFIKAVCGDKSDNITGVFKKLRVGKKTAEKFYGRDEEFKQLCDKEGENGYERFLNNMRLISFDQIPEKLCNDFKIKLDEMFSSHQSH